MFDHFPTGNDPIAIPSGRLEGIAIWNLERWAWRRQAWAGMGGEPRAAAAIFLLGAVSQFFFALLFLLGLGLQLTLLEAQLSPCCPRLQLIGEPIFLFVKFSVDARSDLIGRIASGAE